MSSVEEVEAKLKKVEAKLEKVEAKLEKVEANLEEVQAELKNDPSTITLLIWLKQCKNVYFTNYC